ncbi:hypothetical protein NHX12_031759 [Muraenolepis orangiensis]|uniref:Uncharacterized protein n=1 Tax=Muraenolepis orangiensis TaxID=630683 RepID=A0A9Q0E4D6_9TELE|nr:hypothetical protein NHX12_031759 [Muraenolepis orangiensis]
MCLLPMWTSSILLLCLTRFCLFALRHWLTQARHLAGPRTTPASLGTVLAGLEAIPERLNTPRMTFGVLTVSRDPSDVPDPEAAVSEPESVAEGSVADTSSWLNVAGCDRTVSWVL